MYDPITLDVTIIDEEESYNDLEIKIDSKSRIEITEAQAYALYHKIGFALQDIAKRRTQAAIEAAYTPTPEEMILHDTV